MEVLTKEWLWAMIQAIAVVVTLALIYFQIRIQTSSHVVQTLQSIHTRWTEEPMRWARFKVCTRYLEGKFEFEGEAEYVACFLEELGGYVKMKAISRDVMWDAESWNIEHYFCMLKAGIEKCRQTFHDDKLYQNTVELFNAMTEHGKKKGASTTNHGEDDLRRFAQYEIQVTRPFLPVREGVQSL